jgi:hypothetical protein
MRLHSLPLSPFACPASRCGPFKREGAVSFSLTWRMASVERRFTRDIAFPQEPRHRARRSHLWQGRWVHSVLSLLRLVWHAPSQFVVGASRRSAAPGSQYWSAAEYGSAGVARLRRPELRSTMLSRVSRQASSVPLPKRDAQPFHREDSPRQAGSSLSCQTLDLT